MNLIMSKKKKILLIGGGGHARSCIECIESTDDYVVGGIVDPVWQTKAPREILGVPILGSDEDLAQLRNFFDHALVTVGQIKKSSLRIKLYNNVKQLNYILPVIIASTSIVSKYASVAEGTIIMHHVLVNAGAKIGVNCILNNDCLIEHDVHVGNHCHISTNAVLNGDVHIGNGCFIGSNATIIQGCFLSDNEFICASQLVIKSTAPLGD
jgi:sugar O-acyltransferase (sialic acid O-acetyltransferase NeuD family)